MMANFKCIKKRLAFSLNPEGDFILEKGQEYELPEYNAHIRALAGKGLIEKVKAIPVASGSKTKSNPKKKQ